MTRMRSLRIGAFVTGAVLLLVAALFVFADLHLWRDRDRYWSRFPYSVSGLRAGAPVELWGVRVGSVGSIQLDGEGVRVGLLIEEGVAIPRDARASLKIEGITGIKYIDVTRGDLSGPSLAPGDQIAVSRNNLGEALDRAVAVMYRLDGMVDKLESVLTKAGSVLDNFESLTGPENRYRVTGMLDAAARAMTDTREAAGALSRLAQAADQRVPSLLDSLGRVGRNAETLSEDGLAITSEISLAAADARRAADAIATMAEGARGELLEALSQVRAAAVKAQSLLHGLEDNPARLLRGRPRRELPPP